MEKRRECIWRKPGGWYVGLLTPIARENSLAAIFSYGGKKGDSVAVSFTAPDGSRYRRKARWGKSGRRRELRLPSPGDAVYASEAFSVSMLNGGIAYLNFKSQMSMDFADEYFEKVVPILENSAGVVIDVRQNGGGNSMVGQLILCSFAGDAAKGTRQKPFSMRLSKYVNTYRQFLIEEGSPSGGIWDLRRENLAMFTEIGGAEFLRTLETGKEMVTGRYAPTEEQEIQILRILGLLETGERKTGQNDENRDSEYGEYVERIRNSPLAGKPMNVLIGPQSGSATDNFAASARSSGYSLIGTRTKGVTGTVIPISAGGEWVVWISTNYTLTAEGERINNRGIKAAIYVEQTSEDTLHGIDRQLVEAVEELQR